MKTNVTKLHDDRVSTRRHAEVLADLGGEMQSDLLSLEEQIQAEAVALVGALTGIKWMTDDTFREIASTILMESGDALEVLASGGSLETFRDRGA